MSAQEIRDHIQREYIEPARNRGRKTVRIRAGDIHDEMELKSLQPLVCDTLTNNVIQQQYNIKLIKQESGGKVHQKHGKNIWYTYQLL